MTYELEIYKNAMSDKTDIHTVEGTGFIVIDSGDGSLFNIIDSHGRPVFVIPFFRLKQMRMVGGAKAKKATVKAKLVDIAANKS